MGFRGGQYPLSLLTTFAASSPKGTPLGCAGNFIATSEAVPLGKVASPQAMTEGVPPAEAILNRLPRQPAELLHGKAGLQGAVDTARQQRRAVGDHAVQRAGRDHKVCPLLRLHQGGDARRHHRHA